VSAPSRLLPARAHLFWYGQLLFWGAQGLLGALVLRLTRTDAVERWGEYLVVWTCEVATGVLVTTLLRALFKRLAARGTQGQQVLRGVAVSVALAVVWGVLWTGFGALVTRLGVLPPTAEDQRFLEMSAAGKAAFMVVLHLFKVATWCALYFGVRALVEARERARQAERAQALAQEAQLQMLRYQLNPHFLFNALNSLRGLIAEDPSRAEVMVTELADVLRYSLSRAGEADVALREELEALRAYVALEKVRFEERLQVEWDVAPAALDCRVPGFLLHPLVENAVKYGMETGPLPCRVRVGVRLEGGALRVSVRNSGHWLPELEPSQRRTGLFGRSTGTGLRNVRQRLAHAFPGRHHFHAGAAGEDAVEVSLHIPASLPAAPSGGTQAATPELRAAAAGALR
jgi:signal transduction histidine kinase